MPSNVKHAICPECGLEVPLSRGRIKEHPLKDRGPRSKALCPAVGAKPSELEQPAAADPSLQDPDAPPAPEVLAPTFDQAILEEARPPGAWAGAVAESLDPNLLDADPRNPRSAVTDVEGMAASLIAKGMLQPVVVTPHPEATGRYVIVAGHRRVAGAIRAGWTEVPALVRPDLVASSNVSITAQLVENLQRVPLAPLEEARAYEALRDLGMTQVQIADAVGCNQGQVSKRLALLKLPEAAQDLVGDRLDVASAVELTKLPATAQASALAEVARGVAPERAVTKARAAAEKQATYDRVVGELEAAGVAVIDFPKGYVWTSQREDRPIAEGPDGEPQRWGSHRAVEVAYASHVDEPCHGAAVSDDGDVVYVCLDPTRHGVLTSAQEAEQADAEIAAERARRLEVEAAAQARADARSAAARSVAIAKVSKADQAGVVADWNQARLAHPHPDGWPDAEDRIVEHLLDWIGLPPAVEADPSLEADADRERLLNVAALVAAEGSLRVAYMTVLAEGDLLVSHPRSPFYLDQVRGSVAFVQHFARLAEGGYELTDEDRHLCEQAPPPDRPADECLPPELPERPDDAVAWYAPTEAAAEEGDEARWVDQVEADAIVAADLEDRLVYSVVEPGAELVDASPGDEQTQVEDAPPADPDDASLLEEANAAAAAAEAGEGVQDDEGEVRVPGERCTASRRDAVTAGLAEGSTTCPVCGAGIELTDRGRIRDHDVPEPAHLEVGVVVG